MHPSFESLGSYWNCSNQFHQFCLHKSHCSASSNLAIHKVFLRFSSLIRAISAAHLLMSLLFAVSWVFPSTIIYCSCYPKIFYHFTFTCALFSFQGTLSGFRAKGFFPDGIISSWFSFSHSPRYASAYTKRKNGKQPKFGGLKWTRTTDLPLIRRTL